MNDLNEKSQEEQINLSVLNLPITSSSMKQQIVYADAPNNKDQFKCTKIYETNDSMHSEPNPEFRSHNDEEVS